MMLSEMHVHEAHALKAGLISQAELAAAAPAQPKAAPAAAAPKRDPAAEAQVRLDSDVCVLFIILVLSTIII